MSLVSLRAYYCNMNPSRRPLARGVAGRGVERRAEHRAERRAEHRAPSQYRSSSPRLPRPATCGGPRPNPPATDKHQTEIQHILEEIHRLSRDIRDARVTF